MKPRGSSWIITVFAVFGIIVSAVSLYNHYGNSATPYCTFGDSFNCDLVNRSIYSRIVVPITEDFRLKIPVALVGLLGYVFLAIFSRLPIRSRKIPAVMFITALIGLGYSLYLTYIEAYVLVVWCIFCLGSLAFILTIAMFSLLEIFKKRTVQRLSTSTGS